MHMSECVTPNIIATTSERVWVCACARAAASGQRHISRGPDAGGIPVRFSRVGDSIASLPPECLVGAWDVQTDTGGCCPNRVPATEHNDDAAH